MHPAKFKRFLRVPNSDVKRPPSVWINDDIRPLPPQRRLWGRVTFIYFQMTCHIGVGDWQIGSALVGIGLSVWQTMIAVIIGKFIISLITVYNGYVGAEWHIGFPILSRFVWGIYGHYLALIQRIILSLVWFAVQSWTAGLCVTVILASWIIFNVLMIPMLYIRPERIRKILLWMNIITLLTLLSIMIYVLSAAHGAGPLLSQPSSASGKELGWSIVYGITTIVGSYAVGLTNSSDFTRFATQYGAFLPGDQIFGQIFSINLFGNIIPLFGCLTASATMSLYKEVIWNPPLIAQRWLDDDYNSKARAGAFFAGFGLMISQLALNTVGNAFAMGMDTAGLFPKYVNIRRGAYSGLLLSIVLCPWELLSSASTFISVLSAYSVFLGPMVGIQICDYWVVRHRRLKLSDLYHSRRDGIYYFIHGLNPRAFIAWVVGWAPQLPGFIHAVNANISVPLGCTRLYYLAFPLGFVISFVAHVVLNRIWEPAGAGEVDEADFFGTFTPSEAAKMGMQSWDEIEGGSDMSPQSDEALKGGFSEGIS